MSTPNNEPGTNGAFVVVAAVFGVVALVSCGALIIYGAIRGGKRKAANDVIVDHHFYGETESVMYSVDPDYVNYLRNNFKLSELSTGNSISLSHLREYSGHSSEFSVLCERTFSPTHFRIIRVLREVKAVNS